MNTVRRSMVTTILVALGVSATLAAAPNAATSSSADHLADFRNHVGVSWGPGTGADFDGGLAYSPVFYTLSAGPVSDGQALEVDGITYTWHAPGAGEPDNVESNEQVIPIAAAPGASKLGFLGASHGGAQPAKIVLNYEDGSKEEVFVQLAAWFDALTQEVPGNTTVLMNAAAIIMDVAPLPVQLGVYAVSVPLDTSKTLVSIQLSKNPGAHYMDIQVDMPA